MCSSITGPDEILHREQAVLNSRYGAFVRKYGIVNSRLNRSLFREDADFALLISIEEVDENRERQKRRIYFQSGRLNLMKKLHIAIVRCRHFTSVKAREG